MRLVLGSTGGIGHWVVEKLLRRGEKVRLMVRDTSKLRSSLTQMSGVEIVLGDALNSQDVKNAATGAETIFHCVNVPYSEWKTKVILMLENTLSAAQSAGAKIVFPGNVYVFGHAKTEFVREDHPMEPHTVKGKIRLEMERKLALAWQIKRIPYTIVRMPDFYGPFVLNPLYEPVFRNAPAGRSMTWYGRLDVPFELIYIEDAAEGFVIAGLDSSSAGETYHLPGHSPTTGRNFLTEIAVASGTRPKIRTVPPLFVALAGLFNPQAREFYEMLYLRRERLLLDGSKFKEKFGMIPSTPYSDGIKKTLEWFRHFTVRDSQPYRFESV